jgi:hypothetical protein
VFSLLDAALLTVKGQHIQPLLRQPGFQQLRPAQVQQMLRKALTHDDINAVEKTHGRLCGGDMRPIDAAVGMLCESRHVLQVLSQQQLKQFELDDLLCEAYYSLYDAKVLAQQDGEVDEEGFAAGCVNAAGSCVLARAANVSRLFGLVRLGGATLKGADLRNAWV